MAPFLGGLVGTLLYDTFLYVGSDSVINAPNETARNQRLQVGSKTPFKVPGDITEV
jgi:hypothetical protein